MDLAGFLKAGGWLALTFFYAYIFGGKIPYLVFYTTLAVVVTAFLWLKINTKVNLHCYTEAVSAQVGTKVKVTVEVENNSGWPVPWTQCWVQLPGTFGLPDNLACYTFSLLPREKKVISEELECRLRGHFHWGQTLVRTGDIFGIFTHSRPAGESREIVVFPEIYDLGNELKTLIGYRYGENPSSHHGTRGGTSFIGVRKYDASDGISRIHWKASAKMQSLLVKEFEEQKSFELVIFLDLNQHHHTGDGPEGSIEKAVNLTASVAASVVKTGNGVGLVVYGSERTVLPVSYGKGHLSVILESLVRVRPGEAYAFEEAFGHEIFLLTKKYHVFVITGYLGEQLTDNLIWLKTRGHRSAVFLFKLETFGGKNTNPGNREKEIARLRGNGIPVIGVEKETDLRLVFRGLKYGAG